MNHFSISEKEYENAKDWLEERKIKYMLYPGVSIYIDAMPDKFGISFERNIDAMEFKLRFLNI